MGRLRKIYHQIKTTKKDEISTKCGIDQTSEHIEDTKSNDCDVSHQNVHSISFSGGGYNCVYQLAIVMYIFKHSWLFRDTIYLGTSGGAGMGGIILAYIDDPHRFQIIDSIRNDIIELNKVGIKADQQIENYV